MGGDKEQDPGLPTISVGHTYKIRRFCVCDRVDPSIESFTIEIDSERERSLRIKGYGWFKDRNPEESSRWTTSFGGDGRGTGVLT